jgi:hypothetical protein
MGKGYRFASYLVKGNASKFGREFANALKKEQKEELKEIYERERKQYADMARTQFNMLCHKGKIRSEELKTLRQLIESLLGSYAAEYKRMKFDNEFHRIYTMLMSYHLDEHDWNSILITLEEIQYSS